MGVLFMNFYSENVGHLFSFFFTSIYLPTNKGNIPCPLKRESYGTDHYNTWFPRIPAQEGLSSQPFHSLQECFSWHPWCNSPGTGVLHFQDNHFISDMGLIVRTSFLLLRHLPMTPTRWFEFSPLKQSRTDGISTLLSDFCLRRTCVDCLRQAIDELFEDNECVFMSVGATAVISELSVKQIDETCSDEVRNLLGNNTLGFWDTGNPVAVPHVTKSSLDGGFSQCWHS